MPRLLKSAGLTLRSSRYLPASEFALMEAIGLMWSVVTESPKRPSARAPRMSLDGSGFSVEGDHPWMVRAPGALAVSAPEGLRVERVTDAAGLADFELASAIGFGSPPQAAFTWHAPAVLADPRLQLWRGRLDNRTVSASMSFVEAGVVGIYGVSTVPDARRRGFAGALTRAALSADPSLPSVLQPSTSAEPLYRQLGYRRFTTFRTWVRPAGRIDNGSLS